MPVISAALAYFDGYRSARLPANLLQTQRDYFGAHTYERIDRPGGAFFPHQWDGPWGEHPIFHLSCIGPASQGETPCHPPAE